MIVPEEYRKQFIAKCRALVEAGAAIPYLDPRYGIVIHHDGWRMVVTTKGLIELERIQRDTNDNA